MGMGKSTFDFTNTAITLDGESTTINIKRDNQSYSHELYHEYGDIAILAVGTTSYTWRPIAAQLTRFFQEVPNQKTRQINVYLYTYDGSTLVGQDCHTLTVTLSEDTGKPNALVWDIEDRTQITKNWGVIVPGLSAAYLKMTQMPSGKYGARISKTAYTYGDQEYPFDMRDDISVRTLINALPLTTSPTSYALGCRVTDSRGFSTVQTITKSCARYDYPTIDRFDAIRCDANGNETSSGTKVKVIVKGSWASIGGKNTATLKVGYKLYEDLNFTYQDISVTDGTVDINEILDVILDANENYYFSAMLSDQVNSVSEESVESSDGTSIFSVSADNRVVELNSDYELDLTAQEQINMKAHGIHLTTSEGIMLFESKVSSQEETAGSIIFKGPGPYDVIHFTNAQVTQDIPVLTADCNDLTSSGKYYIGDNSTNRPVSKNGWLESKLYSTDYCHQTYTTYDGEVYVRTMQAETWGAWSNSTIKTTISGDNRLLTLGPLRIIQGSWEFAGVGKEYQKLCTLEQLKQRFGLTSINTSNVYINVMNGDAPQNGLTPMGVQYWPNDGYYMYFSGTLGSGVWMRINYVCMYFDL